MEGNLNPCESIFSFRNERERGGGGGLVEEGRKGKEGCGVRVRGDLRASLYVYHTAARPLPDEKRREEKRIRPRRGRRYGVVSGTVRSYPSYTTFVCLGGGRI